MAPYLPPEASPLDLFAPFTFDFTRYKFRSRPNIDPHRIVRFIPLTKISDSLLQHTLGAFFFFFFFLSLSVRNYSLMEDLNAIEKRGRDESDSAKLDESDSPVVKRLRETLLGGLDDEAEFCAASQDLDSFMKSFEEEITALPSALCGEAAEVVDLTSEYGESRQDIGYLLEASDDDLGIPPTTSSSVGLGSELARVESDSSVLGGEFWDIPSYDSFGFGDVETVSNNGSNGEHVPLDGLFDYSDLGFGSGDFAYRPGTLPAQ